MYTKLHGHQSKICCYIWLYILLLKCTPNNIILGLLKTDGCSQIDFRMDLFKVTKNSLFAGVICVIANIKFNAFKKYITKKVRKSISKEIIAPCDMRKWGNSYIRETTNFWITFSFLKFDLWIIINSSIFKVYFPLALLPSVMHAF